MFGAVLFGGFVLAKRFRREHGRNIFLVARNFAPTWGNRPEYNMDNRLLIGVRSKCYNFLAIQLDY